MLIAARKLSLMQTKGMKMKTKLLVLAASLFVLSGCDQTDAKVASYNLSKAADMMEINRRVVFYNGITGGYMLSLEGRCSIEVDGASRKLNVTCKTGPNEYKKHFLGLSDNVTYFVEQLDGADVSVYHYRVIFKPQTILSDWDARGDTEALKKLVQ